MQHPTINLTSLNLPQQFFIEKSLELLDRNTIDSYRVRVRNPRTILRELKECIDAYERGKIKHFVSIAAKEKDQFALKDEVEILLKSSPNYLLFDSFSQEYFQALIKELSEHNYKQIRNCISILLKENTSYLAAVIDGLSALLQENPASDGAMLELFKKIDQTLDILYSDLLEYGFSKNYLRRYIAGVFVNTPSMTFDDCFQIFRRRITEGDGSFTIIFRLDTSKKLAEALTSLHGNLEFIDILPNYHEVDHPKIAHSRYDKFSASYTSRRFARLSIEAADYLMALKKAKVLLAEQLDIINLGFSDVYLRVHDQVLIVDNAQPEEAGLQPTTNFLDGKYVIAVRLYQQFLERLSVLLARPEIHAETKEKLKSAVRYLRLGNESTEVEHKFINYWIGLEYLFSTYDSNDTIRRVKDLFVSSHSLIYVKRNLYNFYKDLKGIGAEKLERLSFFKAERNECLQNPSFYEEVTTKLLHEHPLLAYRAWRLGRRVSSAAHEKNKELESYVERHRKNLLIHLTRIYRLRNEIIHDAATNTVNEQIAANLRYYLTFILNGAIDFLWEHEGEEVRLENYFILNEIRLGNIRHKGWRLQDLLAVSSSIDFMY